MEKKSSKSKSSSKKSVKTASKSNLKKEEKIVEVEEEIVETKVEKVEKEKSSKGLGLFLPLFLTLVIVTVLSWFISTGVFSGGEFTEGTAPARVGIADFFENILGGMSGVYQMQVIFLAMVGIFYGIVSKTASYKAMIKKFASIFSSKKVVFTVVVSFIITLLASFVNQPLVLVLFVPMIYSVAKELKFSKVSAMLMTFGSLCVGIMGTSFGGYGITYLLQSLSLTVKDGVVPRLIVALMGYFVINGFIIFFNKKNSDAEVVEDAFEDDNNLSSKAWPMITLFAVLFVLVILGFIPYSSAFGIEAFNEFHTWLTTKVVIGSGENEVAIFGSLLGQTAPAFGTWDLYTITYILFIMLIIVKFAAKIKFNVLFDYAIEGVKKMAKPMILVTFAYGLFVVTYNNNSPITSNILNALNKSETFNPLFNALGGFVSAFLHVDFEYSGFLLGPVYAVKYASSSNVIVAITSAMNGFASLFVPSSVIMLTGLSMTNLSYKNWLKAIWKLLLLFVVVLAIVIAIVSFL